MPADYRCGKEKTRISKKGKGSKDLPKHKIYFKIWEQCRNFLGAR